MGKCDVCNQECNPSVVVVGVGEFCMKHEPPRPQTRLAMHLCPDPTFCQRVLTAERAAARRAGKAEGLKEAAEILKNAAAADASNAAHCSAPNHRDRLQKLSENELVMARQILARAEEVER